MPQAFLPLIPNGANRINDRISVVRQDGKWTYLYGVGAVFQHSEGDTASFRMFTAQLICQGACTQADIGRVFAVSLGSVRHGVPRSIVRKESKASIAPANDAGVLC